MRYDRHSNGRRGVRHMRAQPRQQLLGVNGFTTSNYYRTASVAGGPQGSTSMTLCAFFRFNAIPSTANNTIARLVAGSGGYNLSIVNASGNARMQVIDGSLATIAGSNAGLAALVGTDVVVHGVMTGGSITVYVNGSAGSAQAITGYTAPGTSRLGIGISSGAVQPLADAELYGVAVCDNTGLSVAQVSEHVAACRATRTLYAPPGCTYLWSGEEMAKLQASVVAKVGVFDVPLTGALASSRHSPRYV